MVACKRGLGSGPLLFALNSKDFIAPGLFFISLAPGLQRQLHLAQAYLHLSLQFY